jgi:hypothetical protein
MLNLQRLTIDDFISQIKRSYRNMYSDLYPEYVNILTWCSRLALENIANTDALYHNLEHTVMVTMAGQSILEGKHLIEGGVSPLDWLQVTISLLCHDIGYIRGICQKDKPGCYATGNGDETVDLPPGATDVALTPYHVDRSKMFVHERFSKGMLQGLESVIDSVKIAGYIEYTRFPPPDDPAYKDTKGFGGLVRAADFIGQLGDPGYVRKVPALFYEFHETDSNAKFGYNHPDDMRDEYAKFYWNVVSPYIQDALRYLRVTMDGKQWIANLHAHVFAAEHANDDAQ